MTPSLADGIRNAFVDVQQMWRRVQVPMCFGVFANTPVDNDSWLGCVATRFRVLRARVQ